MPPQQQQQGAGDNSLDFLWIIVFVIGLVLAAWYFGKQYIAYGVFYLKYVEILLINFVMGFFAKIVAVFGVSIVKYQDLNTWLGLIHQHALSADFGVLYNISTQVGDYLRYPFTLILLVLAVVLYFGSIGLKFKTKFDMNRLKNTVKVNWPRIMPVVNLDLVNTKLDKMPWAMAQTPMQFAKQKSLLKIEVNEETTTVSVKTGAAHDIFALQLGPLWRGPQYLPDHVRALLAIFTARADNDVDAADELLDSIAASAPSGHLNYYGADKLLAKHINNKQTKKILQGHAYVSTMMAAMLDWARGAGVLASADFIWLKPLDRKLWYVLNSVGRQTAVAEVAGVFAHWLAETRLQGAIRVPMVDAAVDGLVEGVKEVLYEPDEE